MRTRNLLAVLIVVGLMLLMALPIPAGEAPSKEKIDQLIDKLGSGDFSEREKATKELANIGVPALDALRKAAKSDDAEVRKRAEELLPKIEKQAETARVLAPKRVRLVYKDTPLPEALADLQKQCGYKLELHDPDGKLKERKITLDTGDTTFWHAFDLFCAKAELTEASLGDVMQMPRPQQGGFKLPPAPPPPPRNKAVPAVPGAAPAAPPAFQAAVLRPARRVMPQMNFPNAQLLLKDGKPKQLPTDDRSAIRIRALPKSDLAGNAAEGEFILTLEVSPEPKLQWEALQSIHIDKAVDDRAQKLAQVVPQVEGPPGPGGWAGNNLQQRMQMQMQMQMRMQMMKARGQGAPTMGGIASLPVFVQFKKGAKEAKSLKELKGIITANLLSEAQPMIVADKVKAGESVKGKLGGFIKIVEVKSDKEETTIRLEFEQPPFEKVMPAQQNAVRFFAGGNAAPIVIRAAPAGQKMPAPPINVNGQIGVRGGVNGQIGFRGGIAFMDSYNGLSVRDDKGATVPIRGSVETRFQQQAAGVFKQTSIYTLTCRREKDKGQPAKVVYFGRKRVLVDIPFALSEVPLP